MGVKVYVKNEALIVDNALGWCKENNITIIEYKHRHFGNDFGRDIIYGVDFYFNNEEDATAFKLRWG